MKKNKTLRLASALLIATLCSTCVISGTFAKYTTTDNGSDSARVAKWGVTVDVAVDDTSTDANSTVNAFDDVYAGVVSGTTTVKANDDKDVLAPGTSGTLVTAKVMGKPEVMVNVQVDVDLELNGWKINTSEFYCPVVFDVNGTKYQMSSTVNSEQALESVLENAIISVLTANGTTATAVDTTSDTDVSTAVTYAPNYDFGNADSATDLTVTWAWAFDGDDAKDTALGDLATAPTISFSLAITVTQVD